MLVNRAGVVRWGDAGGWRVVCAMDGCAEVRGGTTHGGCSAISATTSGRLATCPATAQAHTSPASSANWEKGKHKHI